VEYHKPVQKKNHNSVERWNRLRTPAIMQGSFKAD